METPETHLVIEELQPMDDCEPTEADIAAAEGEVLPTELKTKTLKEGLGKEGKKDDIRQMLDRLCQTPLLSREEETTIARRVAQGDREARDHLIRANYRLVIAIAKRYRRLGMEFDDLIEEGITGLIRAVDKYEVERGFRFATYATWWIWQSITYALSHKTRTIRMPVHIINRLYTLRKAQQRFEHETGKKATAKDLEKATGIGESEIEFLKNARKHPESLDFRVGQSEKSDVASLTADPSTQPNDVRLQNEDIRRLLLEALGQVKGLKEHDMRAYMLHAGLEDGVHHNARETSVIMDKSFSVTKDRINKVRRALRRFPTLAKIVSDTDD